MADVTQGQILAALKTVDSGTGGLDVVARGWVKDILIKDGPKGSHVTFTLEVPAKLGPGLEPVRATAEKVVFTATAEGSAGRVVSFAASDASLRSRVTAPDSVCCTRAGSGTGATGAEGAGDLRAAVGESAIRNLASRCVLGICEAHPSCRHGTVARTPR